MSIVDAVKGMVGIPRSAEEREKAAKSYAKQKTAAFIREEYEKRKKDRLSIELQWTLNANFFSGNQYCAVNTYRENGIEQIEPVYKWMERETFNRIAPIIETRVSLLQKINYRMVVNPRRNDIDDYAKAEVSTKILSYLQDVSNFDSVKNTAIVWNEICGSCFWVAGWNRSKGAAVAREYVQSTDGDGNTVTHEKVYHEGDIEYSLLSPYEVYPEDMMVQGVENQRSIMVVQIMKVKDAYDRYGMVFKGSDIESFVITPKTVGFGLGNVGTAGILKTEKKEDAVRIITYYERKSRDFPDGRMIIFADTGDEDNVIFAGDLPYDEIPIAQMICKSVPGQFFGKSVIEFLIPFQRAYNGAKNRMHEYLKRAAIQNYAVEEGSMSEDEMEEGLPPGKVVTYNRGSNPPKPLQSASMPSEMTKEIDNLKNDMEYIAGVSQLQTTGNTPSGITSGTAIESLQEIDNTRLATTGEYIRQSVKKMAEIWLRMYKRYATLPRVIKHTGLDGIGNAMIWQGEDINSYEVEFETENELVLSEESQKQNFLQAVQLGAFTGEDGTIPQRIKNKMLESMRIGRYSDIMDINGLQLQAAQRENSFMRAGAWCDINEYDDDLIHAEEHKRFILSTEFQVMKYKQKEYAALIEAHLRAHEMRAAQKKGAMTGEQTNNEGRV